MLSNVGNSSALSISLVTHGSSLETNISDCLRIGAAEILVGFKLPDPTINLDDSVGGDRFIAEILLSEVGWIVCIGLLIKGSFGLTTLSADPDIPRRLSLSCIFKLL